MPRKKTFGKLWMQVDVLGGLKLTTGDKQINVQNWDTDQRPDIGGAIKDANGQTLWEGSLATAKEIEAVFQPLQEDGKTPKTYATRSGSLGQAKNVGVFRLETEDGQTFNLAACNGGEEHKRIIVSLNDIGPLTLEAHANGQVIHTTLFDPEKHAKRVERARDNWSY